MPTSLLNSFAWPIDPPACRFQRARMFILAFYPHEGENAWNIFPLSFIPPFGQSRHNIWKTVHTNTGRALMIGSSQQKHNNLRFLLRGYFTQKGNLIWIFRFKSHFVLSSTNQEVYQCMFMINTWWKWYSINSEVFINGWTIPLNTFRCDHKEWSRSKTVITTASDIYNIMCSSQICQSFVYTI